ncbi:hypothetical protein TrRE_jg9800 [Triparma retinervis]|uniref:Thioredoxin-like fold domain-containing protein n=1 Tax=Triparma retinervis TaxID=2557542 RepID=A0A9W7DTI1_9STRA|nr:hypothetical protein TrRE_jg9800 [Triparma retinervis]
MPPPLPSSPQGIRFPPNSTTLPSLEVGVFIDFNCPFSRKIYNTIVSLSSSNTLPNLHFVFHLVPQPWHPQSSILHEFGLAVHALFGSEAFFKYASVIFSDSQTTCFDDMTFEKSRKEIYAHLCQLCEGFVDSDGASKVTEFLSIKPGSGNSGNDATKLLKFCVKFHRVRGVHVTPTVFINGVEAPDISSGWTVEQWAEKLASV